MTQKTMSYAFIKTLKIAICLLFLLPFMNGCQKDSLYDGTEIIYPISITSEMRPEDEIVVKVDSYNGGTFQILMDDVENVYRSSVPWKVTITLTDVTEYQATREEVFAGHRDLSWRAGKGNTFRYIGILCFNFPYGEISCKLRFNESMLHAIKGGDVKLRLLQYTEERKEEIIDRETSRYLRNIDEQRKYWVFPFSHQFRVIY